MANVKAYGALNPGEIAARFDLRAAVAKQAAKHKSVRERGLLNCEARIWREAAEIIRDTEFVGWIDKLTFGIFPPMEDLSYEQRQALRAAINNIDPEKRTENGQA